MCQTRQDFIMLTDHGDAFYETEFPEALLYRESLGDVLIDRDGGPVANRVSCTGIASTRGGGPFETLLLAGNEATNLMPVGIEGHLVEQTERGAVYGTPSEENAAFMREHGAVLLVAHPENQTVEALSSEHIDGFEMFNLHRLFIEQLVPALDLVVRFSEEDPGLAHPDLSTLRLFAQDALYLELWSEVARLGHTKSMTFGTDCHQNVFPGQANDGERIDSYRRMMGWMSNHLLVQPNAEGGYNDRDLKDALRAGRLYGAFELYGTPESFAFFAEHDAGGGIVFTEMGSEVLFNEAPELVGQVPDVKGLWRKEPPEIFASLRRAVDKTTNEDGESWVEVASAAGAGNEVRFSPTEPGVYRFEITIIPHHLEEELNGDAYFAMLEPHIWVMSNPIYVR